MSHKTTVMLSDGLHLRVRALADRGRKSVSEIIEELLEEALVARMGTGFASHGAGEADVDDLGLNAEKYLTEHLR